jgi:hypothetical protein
MALLGDQLIRDADIAVFELVKNAYDADATSCLVTSENIDGYAQGQAGHDHPRFSAPKKITAKAAS